MLFSIVIVVIIVVVVAVVVVVLLTIIISKLKPSNIKRRRSHFTLTRRFWLKF